MDVDNVMTRRVFTCDMRDTVNRAAQLMWDHNCSCVPIVDGHHKLVGMLTQRDIAMAAYTQGKPLTEIGVTVAMSKRVHAIQEHSSIEAAEQAMRSCGVRRLPVLDAGGHLIGLITRSDIARALRGSDAMHSGAQREVAAAAEQHHH